MLSSISRQLLGVSGIRMDLPHPPPSGTIQPWDAMVDPLREQGAFLHTYISSAYGPDPTFVADGISRTNTDAVVDYRAPSVSMSSFEMNPGPQAFPWYQYDEPFQSYTPSLDFHPDADADRAEVDPLVEYPKIFGPLDSAIKENPQVNPSGYHGPFDPTIDFDAAQPESYIARHHDSQLYPGQSVDQAEVDLPIENLRISDHLDLVIEENPQVNPPDYHGYPTHPVAFSATQPCTTSLPNNQLVVMSQSPARLCGWKVGNGDACGETITKANLSEHLTAHGIVDMSRDRRIKCAWVDCKRREKEMNRESIVRHIMEVHLGLKRSTKKGASRGRCRGRA